ncbi:MAG: hypothetical protein JXJ04_06820 [Spirochaetales bacterium]|nr:hypothetical protein [Spirochaetales bacterium]
MEDIINEIKKKKERLAELIKSRSKANCSATYSSEKEVDRETEIEELEEEIETLESKI